MNLDLADTTVRLYRRKDGSVAVHLRSFIMVHTVGGGFRLSAYLNQFDCSLTFDSGETVLLDNYEYSYDCLYKMDHMVHSMRATGYMTMEALVDTVALLRVVYRLFDFPGQGEPSVIERVVPVLARGSAYQRAYSDPTKWKGKRRRP